MDAIDGRPDVSVRQWGLEPSPSGWRPIPAVLEPDVEVSVVFRLDPQRAVHIDFHGQLVAAIETRLAAEQGPGRREGDVRSTATWAICASASTYCWSMCCRGRGGFSFADAITSGLGLDLPPLPPPFAAAYRVGEVVPVGDDMGSLVGLWRRPLRSANRCPRCRCR